MPEKKLVEDCHKAILAFFRARSTHEHADYTVLGQRNAFHDAKLLAKRDNDGLRYSPGYSGELKLRYREDRGFYLNRNGMEIGEFLEFQEIVAAEFSAIDLRFHRMSS